MLPSHCSRSSETAAWLRILKAATASSELAAPSYHTYNEFRNRRTAFLVTVVGVTAVCSQPVRWNNQSTFSFLASERIGRVAYAQPHWSVCMPLKKYRVEALRSNSLARVCLSSLQSRTTSPTRPLLASREQFFQNLFP